MSLDEHGESLPLSSQSQSYALGHEHLADLLRRHDLLLKREIARGQARRPVDILGFAAISEQEVHRLLDAPDAAATATAPALAALDRALHEAEQLIAGRVERSAGNGVRLPLIELGTRFALTPPEMDMLVACLAVEVDRRYERIYGFLHDDMTRRHPSPGLVLSLYCECHAEQLDTRALLNPLAPLRYYHLVEVQEDAATPWLSRPMRIDERIVSFLLGDDAVDGRIARYLARPDAWPESLDAGTQQRASLEGLMRQVRHWTQSAQPRKKPMIYLCGPRNAGAGALASLAARELGVPLLTFDAELMSEPGVALEQVLTLVFREALLSQAAIFLRNVDRLLDQAGTGTAAYRLFVRCASEMGSIVFASGERPWCWPMPADPLVLHATELQPASLIEQFNLWQKVSGARFAAPDLHRLVSIHPLPLGTIGEAWRMAEGLAAAEDAERAESGPRLEHLHRACRAQAGTPANTLARRIEPRHTWDDLVLPTAQRELLAALCNQAKHASIVYGAWGFDRKLPLGRSLNALFCGPPGTGKTMAAEVIAAELGVEILKIDLAQVVSKYIGETEKNLRQLFDQATSANAILFFDEADALLGKRSEVKDAHDRYANTETAYLLQKMEEYTGLTILSTNLRQNIDGAFTRRMRFIIDFPFPEDEDRLRIWQTVWPKQVPLGPDVDFATLARQFRLSGGSIRNVALAAAFLAAEQSQPVTMRHLMRATRGELQKMGRLVNDEDYRRHA